MQVLLLAHLLAGSAEELKQRLGDHMLATGNLSLAAPPPGGEGAYFGGAAPPPQQQQQHPGHYGGGAGGITYAAPVVQQGEGGLVSRWWCPGPRCTCSHTPLPCTAQATARSVFTRHRAGFTDLGANNNYARPGGQQNV